MPAEGYKTITINEETYKKLEKLADKTCRTIPSLIEYLLKTHNESFLVGEQKSKEA